LKYFEVSVFVYVFEIYFQVFLPITVGNLISGNTSEGWKLGGVKGGGIKVIGEVEYDWWVN